VLKEIVRNVLVSSSFPDRIFKRPSLKDIFHRFTFPNGVPNIDDRGMFGTTFGREKLWKIPFKMVF
jgi:hypothetical protein